MWGTPTSSGSRWTGWPARTLRVIGDPQVPGRPGMARRRRIRARRRRVAQLQRRGQMTTWVFAIPMTCPPWNSGTPSALFSACAATPVKETVMLLTVIE